MEFAKFNEAVKFATDQHAGQLRKMSHIPYILHPMEVAAIIATMTTDEDVMIAGLLHDTIEDCGTDPRLIKEKFGARVSALVQSETEDRLSDRPPAETWRQRKEESLLFLEHTKERDVKILWLADKLSNIRSFYRGYLKDGDGIFAGLNQKDPAMQGWYYKTIAELLSELSEYPAYAEYTELVSKIFDRGGDK